MAGQATDMNTRLNASTATLADQVVVVPVDILAAQIQKMIGTVAMLGVVNKNDIKVFGVSATSPPIDVSTAMKYGSKFFDCIYYFSLAPNERPVSQVGADIGEALANEIGLTKRRLFWMAVFLMLRGSYPTSAGTTSGSDVPAFLIQTCGMNESPAACAAALASFNLQNIPTEWIKLIRWNAMSTKVKQRFALGLAGYRQLGPFKLYSCKPDAPAEVRAAFEWARTVSTAPPDYAICSATRSAALVAKLGSWNKALSNLMLLCFTIEDLNEMVINRIIFKMPVRDVRSDTWRSWATMEPLKLEDPVILV